MNEPYFPHVLGEERTVYFLKSDLRTWQEYPVPDNLEDWYSYTTTDVNELYGKQYDPITNTLQEIPTSREEIIKLRQRAYKEEADPLYLNAQFDVMSGRASPEEAYRPWLAKVAEIKERFPF
ncbi:hypothetical protein [Vibrio cholerae]|uniref:hypothetical protein n=1 Tax=Vibrio cholerae TaxID=666 RepID=UPI00025288AF|nr:hypothetical protein [Vibrio cholerae]AFC58278.1 hypothetical protein O3Y_07000 [Vibrio cholerae IEC224]AUR69697.1 hypothetical protein C1H56_06255 [Vibrio cholerae]AVL22659.1 hypothetical protein VCA1552_01236 [Vibrio cholerae]AWB73980.1 hypothetical protein A1552VC_01238 [Vibrio cholerae]EJH42091.1 hypothetical protein VCCP104619_2422 [Vibrio cholerae CP1046(19)]